MGLNVAQKLINNHLVEGQMVPGEEIAIRIDQTLTQDATGTLVMLELEAMGLERVKTEVSVQYVDHNLIQADFKNPDDHVFLQSACRRFGIWYSPAGNGVSHPVHMQHFGAPGKTLLGSDSHTPAAGSLGMLAIGAGGLDVAMAMAGEPFYFKMPKIWGIQLSGQLPEWVSAKDVILEMLRRHDVDGGVGYILEYYGPGLGALTAMDRHVIANMGTELGATSTVFPSDQAAQQFLEGQGRGEDWTDLQADPGAGYDREEEIDLDSLEPLIAKPSSPGNVVPVREVAGLEIYQSYIGSSANPGYRDFAIVGNMVKGKRIANTVSLDINPTSRQLLEELIGGGVLADLIHAGARLHQAGCNGCIGMGQAPATGRISLRTVPRNFPGRSGTKEDQVYLCSPETAAASALTGVITDPRDLAIPYPKVERPEVRIANKEMLIPPLDLRETGRVGATLLIKGPNIASLPALDALPDRLSIPILLKVGDDISTDEIMPAGARVLPYRSNIPKISEFVYDAIDPGYARRALERKDRGGHAILGGDNYGQGSSREHAALAPRYLGLRMVIARSFARIHKQNLVNFGVLPAIFEDPAVYERLDAGDELIVEGLKTALETTRPEQSGGLSGEGGVTRQNQTGGLPGNQLLPTEVPVNNGGSPLLEVRVPGKGFSFRAVCELSPREREVLLAGGLTNWVRQNLSQ
jgi:aconitate hydratase